MQNKKQKVIVINAIMPALYVVVTSLTALCHLKYSIPYPREMLNTYSLWQKIPESVAVAGVLLVNSVFMSASGLDLVRLSIRIRTYCASFANGIDLKSVKTLKNTYVCFSRCLQCDDFLSNDWIELTLRITTIG